MAGNARGHRIDLTNTQKAEKSKVTERVQYARTLAPDIGKQLFHGWGSKSPTRTLCSGLCPPTNRWECRELVCSLCFAAPLALGPLSSHCLPASARLTLHARGRGAESCGPLCATGSVVPRPPAVDAQRSIATSALHSNIFSCWPFLPS